LVFIINIRAANLPSPKVVQTLIEKCGLNISQLSTQDDYGSTPLHFASVRNNPDTVHMLVKSGSLTSIQNNDLKKPSEVTDNAQIKDFLVSKF
jgi:ankyrin repeat protein